VFSQILIRKTETASYEMRMNDYEEGFRAWKQFPLFGYGYGNLDPISSGDEVGYSNGIMGILSTGGIWISIVIIIPILFTCFKFKKRNLNEIFFIVFFIFEIISTIFIGRFVFIFLLAFVYSMHYRQIFNKNNDRPIKLSCI
jgi:hypothetical protein